MVEREIMNRILIDIAKYEAEREYYVGLIKYCNNRLNTEELLTVDKTYFNEKIRYYRKRISEVNSKIKDLKCLIK